MEGTGQQDPVSTPVSTQAPGQVGALAHPPPFTQVVGLPHSSIARLGITHSEPAVHGCSEAGLQSYASLRGVGTSQFRAIHTSYRPQVYLQIMLNLIVAYLTRGQLLRIVGEWR